MAEGILVETEQFDDLGGWTPDAQFAEQMGSPYLLAHGLGKPVADATTTFQAPAGGQPVGAAHPGAFQVLVNGTAADVLFGADGQEWHWLDAGQVQLTEGANTLALHDLTGFDGRCDAVYFTASDDVPPAEVGPDMWEWRRTLLGIPAQPQDAGTYDLVIAGGGCSGIGAAFAAGKQGIKVALIGDRPLLGGNASKEVGLEPRGDITKTEQELLGRTEDFDLNAAGILAEMPTVDVIYNQSVYAAEKAGDRIVAVIARDLVTGWDYRYAARNFVDATGKAVLALAAGAETMEGREGRATYGEGLAPLEPDNFHHGHTLLFHTVVRDHPVDFPEVPWALDVAKDFDDLNGQMGKIGEENQPGPCPSCGGEQVDFSPENIMHYPATHFWEYGQFMDFYEDDTEEKVRDHLLRALYGTMYNVRTADPETYAGLEFE
jgi:hypothetical protein